MVKCICVLNGLDQFLDKNLLLPVFWNIDLTEASVSHREGIGWRLPSDVDGEVGVVGWEGGGAGGEHEEFVEEMGRRRGNQLPKPSWESTGGTKRGEGEDVTHLRPTHRHLPTQ